MRKSSTLNKKLKSYSALAGATLVGFTASGQIIYSDIDPDVIIDEPGEFYDLDLNQDGIVDFQAKYVDQALYSYTYGSVTYGKWMKGVTISGFGKNQTMGKNVGSSNSIYALNDSSEIYTIGGKKRGGPSSSINNLRSVFNEFINDNLLEPGYTEGYFDSVINKYVGLSFEINGNFHSAWLKVDVIPTNAEDTQFELRLKGFAYNAIPDMVISAGVGKDLETLGEPKNIVASDIGNSYTAADCGIAWDASPSDSVIGNYGVIAIKSAKADTITIQDLIDSESGEPSWIKADGSDSYSSHLELGTVDSDGDPVLMGVAYKIMVFSLNEEGLYQPSFALSNEVILSKSVDIADNIVAADIANNNNGSDMEISFDMAKDEASIEEYRVMIVRDYRISNFDSAVAANVSVLNYTTIAPNGSNQSVVLDAGARDYEGNSISQNTDYYAYVVTQLKDAAGFLISTPSNKIRLTIPAEKVTKISTHDVGNSGNASDLEIRFEVPDSHKNIERIYFKVMPKEQVIGWSDEDIIDLSSAKNIWYRDLSDSGMVDTIRLNPFARTGDYRQIEEGILYSVYPVTSPRGEVNSYSLGTPAEFMLTSPIDPLPEIFAVNIANNFNASDWKIVANIPKKESHIKEYRIMAVKNDDAGSFDLSAAELVSNGNYVTVLPNGDGISQVMPSDLRDVDGIAIENNTQYKFFILAVANSKAPSSLLSEASNAVSLVKASDLDKTSTINSKIYYNNGDIHFIIPALTKNASVLVTNMNGSRIYDGKLGLGQEVINPGYLSSGIYIINVLSDEVNITKKLVVR